MNSGVMMKKQGPGVINNLRFWLAYSFAWLTYAASLGFVFSAQGESPSRGMLIVITCNVVPAVLLGIGVVHLCSYLPWHDQAARVRFFAAHVFVSVLYAALWCVLALLNLSILTSIQLGQWTFNRWGSYAIQWQMLSGLMAYFTIVSSVYVRRVGERLRAEERRAEQLEMRAARAEVARSQAELAALRAQLNPHFLFNTLHSLMALIRTNSAAAEDGLERFAHMLRYVLRAQKRDENRSDEAYAIRDVTLADEWSFVQSYLELERLRLGPRLCLNFKIQADALGCTIPAFTLQPLIENAVKHAIAPRARGGTLRVSARLEGATLLLEVSDDGAGASVSQLAETSGLGLRLVRKSLAARYGEQARFKIESVPYQGFSVRLAIPCNNETEPHDTREDGEPQTTWSYAR